MSLRNAGGLRGVQHPRILYSPEFASSAGADAVECARIAGLVADPWQELAVHHLLGELDDGKWASFEGAVVVPRQNGKGGIIEILEIASIFLFEDELVIHSAHEFSTARAAFRRMEEYIAGTPEFAKKVRRTSHTNGDEGFDFVTGQQLKYRTRTKSGGRGLTGDKVFLDEAMILPESIIGSLTPTMSARSIKGNPQQFYFGSAVDQVLHEHGVVLSSVRHRALQGKDPSLTYLEWSVDVGSPDDLPEETLTSEEAVAQANPTLGIRIAFDHVLKEQRLMPSRTYAVERLGAGDWFVVGESANTVFDLETWRSILDAKSEPLDPVTFGFDVSPNRSRASIAVAALRIDGLWHGELIDRRHGTEWIVDRLLDLQSKFPDASFTCDGKAAASLLPEVEAAGILVDRLDAPGQAQACGFIFDAVEQKTLRVVPANELNSAVRGAAKREFEDSWAWSRKHSGVDITPLVALTDALWTCSVKAKEKKPLVAWSLS